MMFLSGQADTYVANSAAQAASTGFAWTQVIAPAANISGIYVQAIVAVANGGSAQWRFHTALPANDAEGVGIGFVCRDTGQTSPPRIDQIGVIVPAGQGLYVSSSVASSIFYQVL